MRQILEGIFIAVDSVKSNKLRSSLTILSIAIGIFAISGSTSAIDSLNASVSGQLQKIGEYTFSVTRHPKVNFSVGFRRFTRRKPITYKIAKELQSQLTTTEFVSIENSSTMSIKANTGITSDPDVNVKGINEYYFEVNNFEIDEGRGISIEDIYNKRNVAVVGNDIVAKLFNGVSPIGQMITIRSTQYTIVGILKTKGAVMGQSQDNIVMIPLTVYVEKVSDSPRSSVDLSLKAFSKDQLQEAMDETTGILRSIRNVKPGEENDFEIMSNEGISSQFATFTNFISVFGTASGIIALIVAGVGIMNIMLVSVKERTKEIGIRKAVGAKRSTILFQFVVEAVTLCQMGGFLGMLISYSALLLLGSITNIEIIIPIKSFVISIFTCTLIGVVFGLYPAWKASKLDPIEALRYE
jgi:putative ABC transport system permease protein